MELGNGVLDAASYWAYTKDEEMRGLMCKCAR